ncbi:MAG: IucA/IucC family protein, partial [Rhodanobacter sp.]
MSRQVMREQWHDALAQLHATTCWLNCYLREFALPQGEVDFDSRQADGPAGLSFGSGRAIRIRFSDPDFQIAVRVRHVSRLGRGEYMTSPYIKRPGQPWQCADAAALVHFLLERMAPVCGFNHELLAQSMNSVEVTRRLLAGGADHAPSGDSLLDAEQAMIWGHALHPTPKSREGISLDAVLACSPETRTRFPLYWFRVDGRLRKNDGADVGDTLACVAGAYDMYPCHPWEVEKVLHNPAYVAASLRGWIEAIGPHGLALCPTSSVRTMYHRDLNYFLKL